MISNITIGDNNKILPDFTVSADIPGVTLLVIKDSCNICNDNEYTYHWNKMLDILSNKGIWDKYPDGYVKSIITDDGINIY